MKLEVPDPEQPEVIDETQLSMELWVGLVISAVLIFFGWFFWVHPQVTEQSGDNREAEDDEQQRVIDDRAEFEQMVARDQLDGVDWLDNPDRAARAIEVGPRKAAETACTAYEEAIADGDAPRDVTRLLRQSVARTAEQTPWNCLLRLYLDDRLHADGALTDELADFWETAETLDDHGDIMADVIDADPQHWPRGERFSRWLQRCAFAVDYPPGERCRRQLNATNDEADDLLEALIAHLGSTTGSPEEVHEELHFDLKLAAQTLSTFARHGQPEGWHIVETDALPDYDVDFRLGAMFMLCRLVNAPDSDVRQAAIDGLQSVGEIAPRPANPHIQFRWMRSCAQAFGDPEDAHRDNPLLAVSVIDDGEKTVDYGLDLLVEEQLCEPEPGYPTWFCGAERWTGEGRPIRRVMARNFAEAGYVEWLEPEDFRQVVD